MGSDPIAIPMLNALISEFSERVSLEAIFTQPDRRTGRGKALKPNEIKIWAQEHRIPIYQPEQIGQEEINLFRENRWDLVLVMAYGHILKRRLLDMPRRGFYNLHASILPRLRGASPIETAIVTGETETGVTLIKIVPALDAGPIAGIERIPIHPDIRADELRLLLADACIPLLRQTLPSILSGHEILTEQEPSKATYCRLIDKRDGWLDFSLTAQEIVNHVRGFYPWPGAVFDYQGTPIRVGSVEAVERPESLVGEAPGTICCDRKQFVIACRDEAVSLKTLQKPGGKMIDTASFLNGFPIESLSRIQYPKRVPLVADKHFRRTD